METIDLNPDPLKKTEDTLRTVGAWADVSKVKGATHYFVARNPSVKTAISLCRIMVVSFDRLTLTTPQLKCLACALLEENRQQEADRKVKLAIPQQQAKVYKRKYIQKQLF